jgi:hypothetical protein
MALLNLRGCANLTKSSSWEVRIPPNVCFKVIPRAHVTDSPPLLALIFNWYINGIERKCYRRVLLCSYGLLGRAHSKLPQIDYSVLVEILQACGSGRQQVCPCLGASDINMAHTSLSMTTMTSPRYFPTLWWQKLTAQRLRTLRYVNSLSARPRCSLLKRVLGLLLLSIMLI